MLADARVQRSWARTSTGAAPTCTDPDDVVTIAEFQADNAWRVELPDASQVLPLVAVNQADTMATQSQLGAKHIDGRGPPHSAFGVQDGQCGCHCGKDTRLVVWRPFQSDHYLA